METIEEKLKALHHCSEDIVWVSIGDRVKVPELLGKRARLLDELGEFIRARHDRNAAQLISEYLDESHFYLCCRLTARINLKAIARRHGIRNFKLP